MRALFLKHAPRVTFHLHDFIELRLRKEEVTVAMIKDDQYFHQRHILIKTTKTFLILLRMAESNQPHMEKLRLMVLMVDDNMRMYMPDINDKYYFPSVTELEDDEYEEGPGDDNPSEYLSDVEDVSNTEDGITS